MFKKKLIAASFLFLVTGSAFAEESQKIPAVDEIVKKANHMSLYQGTDSSGRVSILITDKQGRTRKREFSILRKDAEGDDQAQKYFSVFHEPADVRKMVFMVHKHSDPGKEDDRWLYMPGLDLVKRIAGSDKRTSFTGSDFLYEDISGRNPSEDTHELISTSDQHYILKNKPRNAENVEFEYYLAYIDKKSFLPLKIEYFKKNNRLYRVIESVKISEIEADENGRKVIYATVTESVAKDLETGSKSEMTFSEIRFNTGLSDDIFTERYLRRPPKNAIQP